MVRAFSKCRVKYVPTTIMFQIGGLVHTIPVRWPTKVLSKQGLTWTRQLLATVVAEKVQNYYPDREERDVKPAWLERVSILLIETKIMFYRSRGGLIYLWQPEKETQMRKQDRYARVSAFKPWDRNRTKQPKQKLNSNTTIPRQILPSASYQINRHWLRYLSEKYLRWREPHVNKIIFVQVTKLTTP